MLLDKWMGSAGQVEPLRLFRTLAVHNDLASRMRPLGAGLLGHGLLAPRDREIMIHRTCARTGAEYEWGVHVIAYGRPLGLSSAQLAATVHGDAGDPAFCERERLLIRLADELHDTCSVSEELWAALAERFSDGELLELLVLAGQYRIISYVVNGARVELEPWAPRFPSAGAPVGAQPSPQQ
ncbi:MAG: carboxymuconolactone decarboxylase family protein [Actinomycetota bacterium]|nr:carboxymuconolactone decarboxylase family protein [Actinomycetota bacterium]